MRWRIRDRRRRTTTAMLKIRQTQQFHAPNAAEEEAHQGRREGPWLGPWLDVQTWLRYVGEIITINRCSNDIEAPTNGWTELTSPGAQERPHRRRDPQEGRSADEPLVDAHAALQVQRATGKLVGVSVAVLCVGAVAGRHQSVASAAVPIAALSKEESSGNEVKRICHNMRRAGCCRRMRQTAAVLRDLRRLYRTKRQRRGASDYRRQQSP